MNSRNDAVPPDDDGVRRWQPTSDELMSAIEKESAARRADCPAFVVEFAEVYATEGSSEDLDRTWVRLVKEYPWYAEDLLHCLDATLREHDRALPSLICDIAQLEAGPDDAERQLSQEERQALARQWLHNLAKRFRPVFEQLSSS